MNFNSWKLIVSLYLCLLIGRLVLELLLYLYYMETCQWQVKWWLFGHYMIYILSGNQFIWCQTCIFLVQQNVLMMTAKGMSHNNNLRIRLSFAWVIVGKEECAIMLIWDVNLNWFFLIRYSTNPSFVLLNFNSWKIFISLYLCWLIWSLVLELYLYLSWV